MHVKCKVAVQQNINFILKLRLFEKKKKKKKKNETLYVHFLVNLLVSKQHFKRTQFSCGDNFDVF